MVNATIPKWLKGLTCKVMGTCQLSNKLKVATSTLLETLSLIYYRLTPYGGSNPSSRSKWLGNAKWICVLGFIKN